MFVHYPILVPDIAFLELCVMLEKAGAALDCITEDCSSAQTLSCIANDYIADMGEAIQAMQENRAAAPAMPA